MDTFKTLPHTNLRVSPLMLGCNVFAWTINENESFKILDAFSGAGFNFIDTADSYPRWAPGNVGGESETIIGNWMKQKKNRNQIIVSTKVGSDMGNGRKGLKGDYIKAAANDSLKRLQIDYIDLYFAHHDDPETPVEETITAFNELIHEGKVRYIGASNLSAERIKASNDFAAKNGMKGYVCLQPLYNLYSREKFEKEYLPLVKEQSLGVTPYYSLASGFLTGKYRSEKDFDKSARGHGMKKYMDDRGKFILKAMDEIAAQKNITLAEIAIAWLLQKPYITAAIASATSAKQLDQLIKATRVQLSTEEMRQLDTASTP